MNSRKHALTDSPDSLAEKISSTLFIGKEISAASVTLKKSSTDSAIEGIKSDNNIARGLCRSEACDNLSDCATPVLLQQSSAQHNKVTFTQSAPLLFSHNLVDAQKNDASCRQVGSEKTYSLHN